ncbi:Conserved_hypothetical protein [Hexamita inflata]|uniref:Uncharacterized protein n=1 Tax=Hexamita inflata TaxID=28002 RepID=A0AA86P3Z6_9EUKA|nr:Conserved hypothetical protein [Hexamita inflata]
MDIENWFQQQQQQIIMEPSQRNLAQSQHEMLSGELQSYAFDAKYQSFAQYLCLDQIEEFPQPEQDPRLIDLEESSKYSKKLIVKRFSLDEIPQEFQNKIFINFCSDSYQFSEQHSILAALTQKMQLLKPDSQAVQFSVQPQAQVSGTGQQTGLLPQKLDTINVVTPQLQKLPLEMQIQVVQARFKAALTQIHQKQGFVVVSTPASVAHPVVGWHSVLSCVQQFVQTQSKYIIVLRPNSKYDEYLLRVLLPAYFPRNSAEEKLKQYRIKLTQQQPLVNQILPAPLAAQVFENKQIFIKPRTKFSKLSILENRLREADLSELDQVVIPLTSQFQTQTAFGILNFQLQQKDIEKNYLWLVRNTGLFGTDDIYLVIFAGCYDIKQWAQSEVDRMPDEWLQRIKLIIIRGQNLSWVTNLLNGRVKSVEMYDRLVTFKEKYQWMTFKPEIVKWDRSFSQKE